MAGLIFEVPSLVPLGAVKLSRLLIEEEDMLSPACDILDRNNQISFAFRPF